MKRRKNPIGAGPLLTALGLALGVGIVYVVTR